MRRTGGSEKSNAIMRGWENIKKTPRTGGCDMSNVNNLEEEISQVSRYEEEKKFIYTLILLQKKLRYK
jgi:hypothetical protein